MSRHYDAGDQNVDGLLPRRHPEPRCTETLDLFAAFSPSSDPATEGQMRDNGHYPRCQWTRMPGWGNCNCKEIGDIARQQALDL